LPLQFFWIMTVGSVEPSSLPVVCSIKSWDPFALTHMWIESCPQLKRALPWSLSSCLPSSIAKVRTYGSDTAPRNRLSALQPHLTSLERSSLSVHSTPESVHWFFTGFLSIAKGLLVSPESGYSAGKIFLSIVKGTARIRVVWE
jgi:hypothetical protein